MARPSPIVLLLQLLLCVATLRPAAVVAQDTDSLASSFFSGNLRFIYMCVCVKLTTSRYSVRPYIDYFRNRDVIKYAW